MIFAEEVGVGGGEGYPKEPDHLFQRLFSFLFFSVDSGKQTNAQRSQIVFLESFPNGLRGTLRANLKGLSNDFSRVAAGISAPIKALSPLALAGVFRALFPGNPYINRMPRLRAELPAGKKESRGIKVVWKGAEESVLSSTKQTKCTAPLVDNVQL